MNARQRNTHNKLIIGTARALIQGCLKDPKFLDSVRDVLDSYGFELCIIEPKTIALVDRADRSAKS